MLVSLYIYKTTLFKGSCSNSCSKLAHTRAAGPGFSVPHTNESLDMGIPRKRSTILSHRRLRPENIRSQHFQQPREWGIYDGHSTWYPRRQLSWTKRYTIFYLIFHTKTSNLAPHPSRDKQCISVSMCQSFVSAYTETRDAFHTQTLPSILSTIPHDQGHLVPFRNYSYHISRLGR